MNENKCMASEVISDLQRELRADAQALHAVREWAERIIRLCDSREDGIKDFLDD